jgi:hypothetical protein
VQDEANTIPISKSPMALQSRTTIEYLKTKVGRVLSVEAEQANDILQLTITIATDEYGAYSVPDAIRHSPDSWITLPLSVVRSVT